MESNARTTSSTAGPAHLAPHVPIPHDLPALPGSDLAALRARIDLWDVRIPTAAAAPVTVTAAQVREQLAASSDDWTSKPVIPGIPGQTRRSPEQKPAPVPNQRTGAYDAIVLGQPHAWSAF